jgi:hypothetical protein
MCGTVRRIIKRKEKLEPQLDKIFRGVAEYKLTCHQRDLQIRGKLKAKTKGFKPNITTQN